jgi:hypothetical protein
LEVDVAYDNTNAGALFKNDDKSNERHPDYKGSLNVGGVDYWLSSWLKTAKDGKKYMRVAVTEKTANNTRSPPKSAPKREDHPFDDWDLPV